MCKVCLSLGLSMFLIGCWAIPAADAAEPSVHRPAVTVSDQVLAAALEADWDRVIRLTEQHPAVVQDAVCRAVLAHAYLAKNHNNRSFGLFAALDADDLERYAKWAAGLVAAGSPTRENLVAQYFYADSLSRQGDWGCGIKQYQQAVSRGDMALAWNGLGVAYTYQDDFGQAKKSFEKAMRADPKLADAHANLGTLLLVIEAGPGAIEQYRQARDKSDEFALTQVGSSLATIGSNRDAKSLQEAIDDLELAAAVQETEELALANLRVLRTGASGSEDDRKQGDMAGTTTTLNELNVMLNSPTNDGLPSGSVELKRESSSGASASVRIEHDGRRGPPSGSVKFRIPLGGDNIPSPSPGGENIDPSPVSSGSPKRSSGGGDTAETALDRSAGDVGRWPAKEMRFGLFPRSSLPHVTKPGT
jgi:tetratricopeptide (TPR) repeat protein